MLLQTGNALHDAQRYEEAVDHYDRAIASYPEFAVAHNNRANAIKKLGRLNEAIESYGRAIALKPDFTNAYYNRANTLRDLGRRQEAIADYRKALTLNPDSFRVLANLATVLQAVGRYEESLASYDRAIVLNPGDAMLYSNRGNTLVALDRYGEAEASFDQAIALKPEFAEAHYCKSLLKLTQGDFEQGWALYEWRFAVPGLFADRGFRQPQWRGDVALEGKTILLHAEQGLGDTLQFCRYVPVVATRAAKVLLEVPHSLLPLMASLTAGVDLIAAGDPLPAFDCHCPLMSLPMASATSLQTIPASIPYLFPAIEHAEDWKRVLGEQKRPRIGLVWSGSVQHQADWSRSIPLRLFEKILSLDLEFHGLQNEVRDDDRALIETIGRPRLHVERLIDFGRTAALVEQMDLVISVDTSLAHLAGALGKPLWLLLPGNADFRWMRDRDDSPWYPTARLYRQSRRGDWGGALDEMEAQLRQRFVLP